MITNYSAGQLMRRAEAGELSKTEMADLLSSDPRWSFLQACAEVERRITTSCAAAGDNCLESGCAFQGEACLEALLNAGPAYQQACGRMWLPFFNDPRNRVE
jgi:hypothetical protein